MKADVRVEPAVAFAPDAQRLLRLGGEGVAGVMSQVRQHRLILAMILPRRSGGRDAVLRHRACVPRLDDVAVQSVARARGRAAGREADEGGIGIRTVSVLRGIRTEMAEHERVRPLLHRAARAAHPESAARANPRGDRLERVEVRPGVGPQHVGRLTGGAHTVHDLGDDDRLPGVLARVDFDVHVRRKRGAVELVIQEAVPPRDGAHFGWRESDVVTLDARTERAQRAEQVEQRAKVIRRGGRHHDQVRAHP